MPIESSELAKEIILEIVRQAGGEFKGMTRLYKVFYLAHLIYFDEYQGLLSDWPIVRMPQGPGIDRADLLLRQLEQERLLARTLGKVGPYDEWRLTSLTQRPSPLTAEQRSAIQEALDFADGKTGKEMSEAAHHFSRSWMTGKNGSQLNIYLDIMDEERLKEGQARQQEIEDDLKTVFG